MANFARIRPVRAAWLAAVILAGATQASVALDMDIVPPSDPSANWVVTLGVTPVRTPRYEGADKSRLFYLPSFAIRRADEMSSFSAPDESFDVTAFSTPSFRIGPAIGIRPGRSVGSDPKLVGLTRYPWTAELGGFAEYWLVDKTLRSRVEILHGFRNTDGFIANLSADAVWGLNPAFTLSGGPRVTLADSRVMELEFGVTPQAALSNGAVTPYKANGGLKSAGFQVAGMYDWSEHWRLTAYHRYDRLVGSAGASPITTNLGTPNQLTFGVGVSYSFGVASH